MDVRETVKLTNKLLNKLSKKMDVNLIIDITVNYAVNPNNYEKCFFVSIMMLDENFLKVFKKYKRKKHDDESDEIYIEDGNAHIFCLTDRIKSQPDMLLDGFD